MWEGILPVLTERYINVADYLWIKRCLGRGSRAVSTLLTCPSAQEVNRFRYKERLTWYKEVMSDANKKS